jgi:hypothetical protein
LTALGDGNTEEVAPIQVSAPWRIAWGLLKGTLLAGLLSLIFSRLGVLVLGNAGFVWSWIGGALLGALCSPLLTFFDDGPQGLARGRRARVATLTEVVERFGPYARFLIFAVGFVGGLSGLCLGVLLMALVESPWGNLTTLSGRAAALVLVFGPLGGGLVGAVSGSVLWLSLRRHPRTAGSR